MLVVQAIENMNWPDDAIFMVWTSLAIVRFPYSERFPQDGKMTRKFGLCARDPLIIRVFGPSCIEEFEVMWG